ncbi:MAG: M20/M25/M40 family metallo-hydrolase, partial [Candidatus Eremiobacteraeota bacterium]|nr:M20/M25/M40 family metallo-hydrolase [Candidatus Eremiobacteraeota bacterium]
MNELEERVLRAVDETRLVRLLQDMVRHKSYSNSPGEGELAHWLAGYIRPHGLDVTHQNITAERLNTIAYLRGTGGGTSLMLNGHIDTNMVGMGWTRDPWGGEIDDGCLYGIGVSNMKAADAAMIEAACALKDAGVSLHGDLIVAL